MAEYHAKAQELYNELNRHEAYLEIRIAKAKEAQDYVKLAKANIEEIKTRISELKAPEQPHPDILGEAITEPYDLAFTPLSELRVGDSFYNEARTKKWVVMSQWDNLLMQVRNVVDGYICYMPLHTKTYQRNITANNDDFMQEMKGDFTSDELKNYQPK